MYANFLQLIFTFKFYFSISGPPENFCKLKSNGNYANPKNPQQFFTCTDNVGSLCSLCPGNLVYGAECGQCLRPGTSCPSTVTSKPTTAGTRPTQGKPKTTKAAGPKCKQKQNLLLFFIN